ncbi:4,5-DOPA dioxygenase extradiol [Prolixibacter sp. NT017]|uniref:4,5-DOPA-extradiol-dioxygenase n=1 Tax=Prolixibacter sp. NT017 TaxID=2652390 RepID=UPI0012754E7C|nr:4,5-DOPA dioxygenase extradiol [Prolixibacter sp. NT017]GET24927.1 dioxygenase [Prolixibacter sp. NT017]
MKLDVLDPMITHNSTALMPVLFVGHGNPMNAIEENEFVESWRNIGKTIPKPSAILCISAHWETRGTLVTAMEKPMTIHDFGGFPKTLFDVQYPAPGSTELAKETQQLIHQTKVGLDDKWGLDHGAWSVIKHLYPEADVPVVEMSLDYFQSPKAHYDLARELAPLRRKGVLIIGSGNMVHNLRRVAWDKFNENYGYDWAIEANEKMKRYILDDNHQQLINIQAQGSAFQLAIPTPEHYLPLLYALALKEKNEQITLFNDQTMAGSLSMTSVKIDKV